MSHSFCLCRASLLRRRPDESARERSALAVVRVRHLRDRAGPASVDEHTICAHRLPASARRPLVPVSWARICGPGRAACQSKLRLSHSRITCSISQFARIRMPQSVNRRIAPARLFFESRHAISVPGGMTASKMLLQKTNCPRQVRSFIDCPT